MLPERVPYGSAYGVEALAAQNALQSSATGLVDEAANGYAEFHAECTRASLPYACGAGEGSADSVKAPFGIAARLPAVYEERCASYDFLKKWFITVSLVGWKLGQAEAVPLSNVAEELACHILIEDALAILGEEPSSSAEANNQLSWLYEEAFEDNDFQALYEIRDLAELNNLDPDGHLGITDLRFGSWFEPFGSGVDRGVPHPYLRSDPSPRT